MQDDQMFRAGELKQVYQKDRIPTGELIMKDTHECLLSTYYLVLT